MMDNIKVLTIRIPMAIDKELTEIAGDEDLSKNQVIKKALRMYLKQHSKTERSRHMS